MKLRTLLVLGLSLFSLNAFADRADNQKLLEALKGSWHGSGQGQDYVTGRPDFFSFNMNAQEWGTDRVRGRVSRTGNQSDRYNIDFELHGNFISVYDDSAFGRSAFVEHVDENELTYRVQVMRYNTWIDQVTQLYVSGNALSARVRYMTMDGRIAAEESFRASK
jgi:hypothetical protein